MGVGIALPFPKVVRSYERLREYSDEEVKVGGQLRWAACFYPPNAATFPFLHQSHQSWLCILVVFSWPAGEILQDLNT